MEFKSTNNLPDDLISAFTTDDSGDRVVEEGVMIPLPRINNYPYTVYFNLSGNTPELLKQGNNLQVKQDGYRLHIQHGYVYLYTIPYIRSFTDETLERLKEVKQTFITLENGWYAVSVLGGETRQVASLEPTLEFVFTKSEEIPTFSADVNYSFTIVVSEY
jgi:hypothetical protein